VLDFAVVVAVVDPSSAAVAADRGQCFGIDVRPFRPLLLQMTDWTGDERAAVAESSWWLPSVGLRSDSAPNANAEDPLTPPKQEASAFASALRRLFENNQKKT